MKKRNRVRSHIQTRRPASRKGWIPYEGDPYEAYPNWEAFAMSARYGGLSGDGDLGRNDWGRAQAYQLIGIANRCIDLIANTVNSIPWNIVRKKGKEKIIVSSSEEQSPSHPLAQAMNDVYARQGIAFNKLLIYSRLQFGETYIEKRMNLFGLNRGLTWLNPYWAEPDTATGTITGFRYGDKNGQQQVPLKPWQVAYEHTYNPTDNLRGLSKLDAAMFDINTSKGLKRFIKWTMDNNARPGLVVNPRDSSGAAVPTMLGEEQMRLIESRLSDDHIGPRNASRALILPWQVDVTTLEGPELDKYRALLQEFQEEICVVFGVPMSMAGNSSGTRFKDGDNVYDDAFINNTIKPHVKDSQDFINVHIMPFLDDSGDCALEYDLSAYEDTTEGDRAKADLIAVRQDKGWLTLADAQRAQGLPAYPEYEGMVMINGVITPLAQIGQMTAPLMEQHLLAGDGVAQVPSPSITSEQFAAANHAPTQAADSTKDMPSASVVLSFAGNVDLIALQRDLKTKFAAQNIRWTAPDMLHLTLISLPTVDDAILEQLAALVSELPPPELDLNIGSLASFDRLSEHALHFRIRRNADLEAYQEDLYALCESLGLQPGQYSLPQNWKPHITMGYASQRVPAVTFQSRLKVSPAAVQVSVKRDQSYEVIGEVACGPVKHAPHVFEKALPVQEWREKALNELKVWQRHVKAGKTRPFEPVYTRDLMNTYLPAVHGDLFFDYAFAAVRHEPFKATLARVERTFNKDIGETRQEFEDEFLLAIADTKDGAISAEQLQSILNAVVDQLGEQAYRDGLEDGGIADADLDEDDRATITRLTREAKGYIKDFIAAFDTYSDLQLDQRPKLWANKTLQGFYDHGLAAADANGLYVWVLGQTEQHCSTCLAMAGERKRMKRWLADGILPKSDKLECGGWNCDCGLKNVRGNAQGKTHDH